MSEWVDLDPDLIVSEVCMDCGRCCKTTWVQDRYAGSGQDRLPYLQAMFSRSAKTYVEPRGEQVACVNWCSQLKPDLTCNIYKDRPKMCSDYNCFKAANGAKRLPEYYDHIKKLVERVHGIDLDKRRNREET